MIHDTAPYAIISGGFDPITNGHIDLINFALRYGKVIILLNSDEWLIRKKGKVFQKYEDRKKIMENIQGIMSVQPAYDDDDTVCEGLRVLKNNSKRNDIPKRIWFINGGDRGTDNTPEQDVCAELGIECAFDERPKVNSSSNLLAKWSNPTRVAKPWGYYEVIYEGEGYKVKRLMIKPNGILSLQKHTKRAEHWVVVEGCAEVMWEDVTWTMVENDTLFIPPTVTHRISNKTNDMLVIIEVQYGDCDEDDIIRLDDIYGRIV